MSLGLLARDSIQDLENFHRKASSEEGDEDAKESLETSKTQPEVDKAETGSVGEGSREDAPSVANPQQAQEEDEKKEASPSRYSGFSANYPAYGSAYTDVAGLDNYHFHDSYAPVILSDKPGQNSTFFKCLLPCLFPWMQPRNIAEESSAFAEESYEQQVLEGEQQQSREEDEISSSSDRELGKLLSDKERQAVMARLRLTSPNEESQKGLLNGIPTYDTSPLNEPPPDQKPKGILKRRSASNVQKPDNNKSISTTDGGQPRRRSLFPSYETSSGKRSNKNVSFAPMARVVTVKSRNDMEHDEKADIWWQRSDYEDFRKTGRIITKAMLAGGSEIWLASNKSWHSPNQSRGQTLKHAFSLSGKDKTKDWGEEKEEMPEDPADVLTSEGDKWWHKFGHSRRGLEHVVSMDEGRQRQQNVRNAIRAALEEQERQRTYNRQDPEKLRHVSLHNTSWARDLALASGASDADAVQSSFAKDRKSREFYLIKMARTTPALTTGRNVPEFMQPALHTSIRRTGTSQLDANTAAQIRYRRKQQKQGDQKTEVSEQKKPAEKKASDESLEPVHDPGEEEEKNRESLAHRAAGFSADEDEKVNMAAVLSGMGAVSQEPQSVHS